MNQIKFVLFFAIFCLTVYSQKKLIAFSSDATSNNKQQIFIMDENGDGLQQITSMEIDCYFPKFSPDGRKIVFYAKTELSDMLYMVNLEDSSTYRFPAFIDGGSDASFSPDGRLLIYRSEKDENNAIYITELDSSESFAISDGSLSMYAKFSPDGNKVIYSSSAEENFDLVVLDLNDTTDQAQKTIVSSKDAELYGTFSPDGKRIAFSSFDINYKGTLKLCDAEGNNIKVVASGGSAYNPKFSPDGKYLGFVWNKGGNLDLYICNSDGIGIKQITSGSENTVQFDWSGDGKKLVYESVGEGISSITVLEVETGSSQNLTGSKANNINPSFQK
ncbi:MAG TPA: DPP IV N-terminal domain-containing protein [Ignavibacteria bacterium]|jgi:TolB protein